MRRLLAACLVTAAALPAGPARAGEVVLATDRIQSEPPISWTADCVAAGVAPGRVVVAGIGTSWGGEAASVACRLYEGDRLVGTVAAAGRGPVAVAGPGVFTVGPGPVTVSAANS